jgi:hypothetical protein
MINPITPTALKSRDSNTPDYVIAAFNRMIDNTWDGHTAKFNQESIIEKLLDEMHVSANDYNTPLDELREIQRKLIFDEKLLDVTFLYQTFGWYVDYDKTKNRESFTFMTKWGST